MNERERREDEQSVEMDRELAEWLRKDRADLAVTMHRVNALDGSYRELSGKLDRLPDTLREAFKAELVEQLATCRALQAARLKEGGEPTAPAPKGVIEAKDAGKLVGGFLAGAAAATAAIFEWIKAHP